MKNNWQRWFEENRHQLSGNGNWLQGHEPNTIPVEAMASAEIKVLIARLSSYADVSRGITHSFLYQLAASVEGCYVDMAFFPNEPDEKLLRKHRVPLWLGTSSKIAPADFDLIAISNSVLQELVNLPAALHYSGIEINAEDRGKAKRPLLIIGGSNSYNLSILHDVAGAGLVDGVLVGDGETAMPQIVEIVKKHKNCSRDEVLKILRNRVAGFYDPACYRQRFSAAGELEAIESLNEALLPVKSAKAELSAGVANFTCGPILYDESCAGASHLLMTAGCPSFCSFCKESWEQKPYREKPLKQLVSDALELKSAMGLSEIALMSFNATTYTGIFELIAELDRSFARVSIKSQRFDTIATAPELLELQFDSGKRTYTCAMEGISERLRILLQKNLSELQILSGLRELIAKNMRQLKVFIIVTGYENGEDLLEFRVFLDKIKSLFNNSGSRANITFSFACLFRPPHTPLQFAGSRLDFSGFEQMLKSLAETVVQAGFEARTSAGPADAFFSEFIAYADRRFKPILVSASIDEGFRYRGEVNVSLARYVMKKAQEMKLQSEVSHDLQKVWPWDDIDSGVSKEFLFQNYQKLVSGQQMTSCISMPWGSGSCKGCSACADADEVARVTGCGPKIVSGLKLSSVSKPVKILVRFDVPELWAWCGHNFIKAALARRLMLDNPDLVKPFLRVSRIFPEFFASGQAVAEVEFRSLPKPIVTTDKNVSDDIKVIGQVVKRLKIPDDLWPMHLEFSAGDDVSGFSRKVDALLSRYRLKHLKQRQGQYLNWLINKGQAKKNGIEKISLHEEDGMVVMLLIKMPELHLLNQFTASASIYNRFSSKI